MQHECKITVLETKVFPELQEKYLADPKSGPCPCFKVGDTFLLKRTPQQDDFYHLMNGKFCEKHGMLLVGMFIQHYRVVRLCMVGQMMKE